MRLTVESIPFGWLVKLTNVSLPVGTGFWIQLAATGTRVRMNPCPTGEPNSLQVKALGPNFWFVLVGSNSVLQGDLGPFGQYFVKVNSPVAWPGSGSSLVRLVPKKGGLKKQDSLNPGSPIKLEAGVWEL